MSLNDNSGGNSWSTYSRLVLKELERLNEELVECKKENIRLNNLISLLQQELHQHNKFDDKSFATLKEEIKEVRDELVKYTKEVNEVWSPKQMQQVKNEVYQQKNQITKVGGIVIAITVIVNLLIAFKEQIFGY